MSTALHGPSAHISPERSALCSASCSEHRDVPVKGMSSATLQQPQPPYGVPVPRAGVSLAGISMWSRLWTWMLRSRLGSGHPPPGPRLLLTGREPGKTTGSVCIGRSPRLILRGSFSSDLIWTAASLINHGLMRALHLPALAFNIIEEDWSSSRS